MPHLAIFQLHVSSQCYIYWWRESCGEYTEKTTELLEVTDKH